MKRTLGWHGTPCLGAACLAVLSGAAGAQNLPAPAVAASAPAAVRLQPVIISAERREENIKNVPVSASTISDEKLDALNSSGQDLQMLSARVPSLNVESSFGRSYPRLYIRGYGNVDFHQNASQPVSLVYDDVVLESSVLKGFPAFDLDRIEVLRGPQGTLFGRNTPAGVIKFDSVRPQRTFGGYVSVSDATYNTANIEGALNVPLSDAWAMRVSLLGQHRDDWIDNIHTGQSKVYGGYDDSAARMQFLYQPAADFSALANVHARRLTGSASLFRANAIQPGSNDLVPGFRIDQVETDGANGQSLENYGANLRVRYNLGRHTLHSITGLESVHVYSRGDIDGGYGSASSPLGGPSNVPFSVESADGTSNHRQFTQEFRVESSDPGPTNWQAGLYYFNEGYDVRSYSYDSLAGGAQTALIKSTQDNVAWAAFGSVRHDVSEQLNLRGGLRYTRDRKTLVTDPDIGNPAGLPVDASRGLSARPSNSKVSWDLSALYKLSADTNLYSRLATAFRGATVQPAAQFNPMSVAQPETVVSVEGGVKSSLFDQRTRLSFGVYRFEVKNQQLSAVGGGSNQTTLVNAKQVIGQGVELDLESYLTDRLLVTLGASYNHTRIDDPNLEVARCAACTMLSPAGSAPGKVRVDGNPLPQAPRWVANFTARYGMPFADGELFAFTDWAYRGEASLVLYKSKEFVAKPLLVGGLRLGYGWADGKYEAALFGRNITNQIKLVGGIDFNNLTGFVNDFSPRIWGVQFKAKF